MTYTLPRGTKDILPDEMPYWHLIESASRAIFSRYNCKEIRTPVFELTDVFERGIGDGTDIVEKEMYTFVDKGDRRLTLRPEGTAPIVRSYIQHHLYNQSGLMKLYYCGPMFRYERPQSGRYRQFHQIGLECLGSPHPSVDAEVISLGVNLFDDIGMSGLSVTINSVGCPVCRSVIIERLRQFMGHNVPHLCGDCQRRFQTHPLRILDCKNESCRTYLMGAPDIRESLCQECVDHFAVVCDHLDHMGIVFQLDPTLVRGLDYYTRTTFEIVSDQLGAQNALCGGGRYDGLVQSMGGPPIPAVGFAFGVERAVMILKEFSDVLPRQLPLLYVAPIGVDYHAKCVLLCDALRRHGFRAELDCTRHDIKPHLKAADRLGATAVLMIGETESKTGSVAIKWMATRKQVTMPTDHVVAYLQAHEAMQC
ncbi:histidine--tRNA ligase [bacterium]|nr:histidine--tRNA ligase [bacterium]